MIEVVSQAIVAFLVLAGLYYLFWDNNNTL
jgi:hypothetical protein